MILVVGTVRLEEGAFDKLLPAAKTMMAETRKETGCIAYTYSRDLTEPDVFHVTEKWENRAVLAAHFETPHMKVWRAALADVGLLERDLRAFESDEGEVV